MNWDEIEGNWKQLQGKFKEKWGRLTHDDLTVAKGIRDRLVGRLQALYGSSRDKVQQEIDRFIESLERKTARKGP